MVLLVTWVVEQTHVGVSDDQEHCFGFEFLGFAVFLLESVKFRVLEVAHGGRLDFILEFGRILKIVVGQVETLDSDGDGGFVAGVVESAGVVEVVVRVVTVVDACRVREEFEVLGWFVVGHRGHFSVHTVDFGFLNQKSVPGCAHDCVDAHLVLDLLFVRGPSEATFAFAASLFMPRFELLDELLIVVVKQTLVLLVFGVVIDVFEIEQLLFGFHVHDSIVVKEDSGFLVDGRHFGCPELDFELVSVAQEAQVHGHVGVVISITDLVSELVVE